MKNNMGKTGYDLELFKTIRSDETTGGELHNIYEKNKGKLPPYDVLEILVNGKVLPQTLQRIGEVETSPIILKEVMNHKKTPHEVVKYVRYKIGNVTRKAA